MTTLSRIILNVNHQFSEQHWCLILGFQHEILFYNQCFGGKLVAVVKSQYIEVMHVIENNGIVY